VAGLLSATDKTKLDGVAAGAEVNVNADWNAGSGDAQILNKPTIGTSANNLVQLDGSARLPAVDGSQLTGLVAATDLSYTAATRVIASSTGTDATLTLVTSTDAGLAPASGGGTTNFLRADGTFAAPPGGSPGGSTTQVQFNNAGAFAGDADLTWNSTTNVLGVTGDVNLSDGGTYTTTLQTITPTAARTISLPDATGTVALVAGSSGSILYNNGGALAGISTLTYDGTTLTTAGRFINSYNATASTPAKSFTGTWFTGGTSTTTKPQVLIEPTGATSTNWSTSGTGLGVNAASGFTGNLLDLQVNGTRQFAATSAGNLILGGDNGRLAWVAANGRFALQGAGGSGLASIDLGGVVIGGGTYSSGGFISNGVSLLESGYFGNSVSLSLINSAAIGWKAGTNAQSGTTDLFLFRDAANTLAQRNGTNAQTFRCYGTFTDASNYVRAALSSSSTAVTLAAETAGTGADNIPLNLTAAGTGTIKVNSVAEVVVSSTVAGLPATPVVGMLTRVTDATAPAVGTTVAGGGAAAALCWYNGANWSVIGV
jgi:hypothetical protein